MRVFYFKILIWAKFSKSIFVQGWIPRSALSEPQRGIIAPYLPRGGAHDGDNNNINSRENDDLEADPSIVPMEEERHQGDDPNDHDQSDDEKIDGDNSARILENVEIIPFDSDSGEIVSEKSDDDGSIANEISDDEMGHEIRDERFSNVIEEDLTVDISKDEEEKSTVSGPTSLSTQSQPMQIRQGVNSSSLRERITHLIRQMEQHDIERFGDTIKDESCLWNQMYRRAHEYVEELEMFEQHFRRCLSESKNLPSLEKAAPHPKSFLHFIAPKIHAIRLSPEVMLKIRNAEIEDVRHAVTAIALMGCLVDLYITVLRHLNPNDADNIIDSEVIKGVIREDRRFQQLMECASCGINFNHWLQKYERITSRHDLCTMPNEYESDHMANEISNVDEELEEQQTECSDLSFCYRWMIGILSLGISDEESLNSKSGKEIATAMAMKSYDLLHSERFIKRLINDQTRTCSLDEVIDVIRVVSFSKDAFHIDLDFILYYCIDLLWKDIKTIKEYSAKMYSELQVDEIINKLSVSEKNGTEDKNTTSTDSNRTAVDYDDVLTEEIEDHLVNYLSAKKCIKVLKALLRNPSQRVLASPTMTVLMDKGVTEVQNEVKSFLEIKARNADLHNSLSPIQGNLMDNCYFSDDRMGNILVPSQNVFYNSSIMVNCLGNITQLSAADSFHDELGMIPRSDFNTYYLNVQVGKDLGGNVDEMMPSGFSIPRSSGIGVRYNNDAWKEYFYECSVIIHAVSILGHRFGESIMETCLLLSEEFAMGSLDEIEDTAIMNFIGGVSSICSNLRLTKPLASRFASLFKAALKMDCKHLKLRDITRLLESIATTISTQHSPITHQLANEESLQKLLEHGLLLVRGMKHVPIRDLILLAWVYSEQNKFCNRSSWGNFELLGHCVAAVSSNLSRDGINDNFDHGQYNANEIGCDALCKLVFALSLYDLEIHEVCDYMLQHFRQDWERFEKIHILDKIRFLFSLAKSIKDESSINAEFTTDIKKIVAIVLKADLECLSPYYYALAVWSIGRLYGEKTATSFENIPSYTREDISLLYPEMGLRMLHGLLLIISEQEMHRNVKAQLLMMHLLSHVDDQMKLMLPKELCFGGSILLKLREFCLSDELVDQQVIMNESNEVCKDNIYDMKSKAEEFVIGSLFPGSNIREIFHLCDSILLRLLNHVKAVISSFTAREMKVMLDIARHMQHKRLLSAITNEIDSRVELARKCLLSDDQGPIEDVHHSENDDSKSSGTYTSKIRRLFSSSLQLETNENESESRDKDELDENINVLRCTLNDMASNDLILKAALDGAYDLGICAWHMKIRQEGDEAGHPPLSYLYL